MKMKSILLLALSALLLLSSVACQSAPNATPAANDTAPNQEPASAPDTQDTSPADTGEKELTFAYICKILDNPWFQGTTAAFEKRAKELGVTRVLLYDSKMDPETCMSQVDMVIAEGVDALAINLPDEKMSRAVADKLFAAGIPFIAADDPFMDDGVRIAPSYELDAYTSGAQMGDWLAKYVLENDLLQNIEETMYVNIGVPQIASFVPRTLGCNEAWSAIIPDYPADRMKDLDAKTGEPEESYNVMAAQITAHPEIKTWFVTGVCDEVAVGAARALEAANLDKTSYVTGAGGYMIEPEWETDHSCIVAANYIPPEADGTALAEGLFLAVTTGAVPFDDVKLPGADFGIMFLTPIIIVPEDYRQIMGLD